MKEGQWNPARGAKKPSEQTKDKQKKGKETQQEEQRSPASKDEEIQQVKAKKSSNAWLKQRGRSTLLKYIG